MSVAVCFEISSSEINLMGNQLSCSFCFLQSGWFIQTDLHQKVCRKWRKWRSHEESQRRRKQVRNYTTYMVTCKANVLQWQKLLDCTILLLILNVMFALIASGMIRLQCHCHISLWWTHWNFVKCKVGMWRPEKSISIVILMPTEAYFFQVHYHNRPSRSYFP